MEAVRDIVHVKSNRISYELPVEFSHTTVELIVLPVRANPARKAGKKRKLKTSRGALNRYANRALVELEKTAWAASAGRKHEQG